MDLIERVARAMWETRREKAALKSIHLEEWGDGAIPLANHIMDEARAAIEVMFSVDVSHPVGMVVQDMSRLMEFKIWDGKQWLNSRTPEADALITALISEQPKPDVGK